MLYISIKFFMKKKINNFGHYSKIINQIEKVRKKNNKNWMDLLRISFRHNPTLSKKVVRQIFSDDRRINNLVKKLIK